MSKVFDTLVAMEKRKVITTDPKEKDECCGIPRDDDGFCVHREGHPIYLPINVVFGLEEL